MNAVFFVISMLIALNISLIIYVIMLYSNLKKTRILYEDYKLVSKEELEYTKEILNHKIIDNIELEITSKQNLNQLKFITTYASGNRLYKLIFFKDREDAYYVARSLASFDFLDIKIIEKGKDNE